MSKMQPTPPRLRTNAQEALFFEELKKRVNVAAVTAATASTVSVDSADATDLASVITLANELKADVNTLVSDLNSAITQLNAVITALQDAGTMDS